MKRYIPIIFIISIVALLAGFFETQIAASEKSASTRVLAQTGKVIANLKITRYSHRAEVNEKAGLYALDCSGLAFFLLQKAAPNALSSIPVEKGHIRPRAVMFYSVFSTASEKGGDRGWQRIPRLLDALPGDFIAWRLPVIPEKGDTGHIVILIEKPVKEKDGTVRVVVFDSSKSCHAKDSRPEGTTGVGTGTMWFSADKIGAPVSFYWSSRKNKPTTVPIAIGRVKDIPEKSGKRRTAGHAILAKAKREQLKTLDSKSCSVDKTNPNLPEGLKEKDLVKVYRNDGKASAIYTLRFRDEPFGTWYVIRMTQAGRARIGYGQPNREKLKIELYQSIKENK